MCLVSSNKNAHGSSIDGFGFVTSVMWKTAWRPFCSHRPVQIGLRSLCSLTSAFLVQMKLEDMLQLLPRHLMACLLVQNPLKEPGELPLPL